jgi:hypothetical protein
MRIAKKNRGVTTPIQPEPKIPTTRELYVLEMEVRGKSFEDMIRGQVRDRNARKLIGYKGAVAFCFYKSMHQLLATEKFFYTIHDNLVVADKRKEGVRLAVKYVYKWHCAGTPPVI